MPHSRSPPRRSARPPGHYRRRRSRSPDRHRRRRSRSPDRQEELRDAEGYFESRRRQRKELELPEGALWSASPSSPPSKLWSSSSGSDSEEALRRMIQERKHRKSSEKKKAKKKKQKKEIEDDLDEESPVAVDVGNSSTKGRNLDGSSEDEFGPKIFPKAKTELSEKDYGGALRPGEGSAIASFVQAGVRIPRRGEIGLTSEQIQEFEDLGYVMSGSRHRRMNAVRLRKENQVYSAEEQRALAQLDLEERAKREQKVISDLRKILESKK